MSYRSRVSAAVILSAFLLCACGDDGPVQAPQIDALRDENGDGVAYIGEEIELIGVTDERARISIDGIEAPLRGSGEDGVVVRVPADVAAGPVPVVAENDGGASPALILEVRRLAYTADFSNQTLSVLEVDGTDVAPIGEIAVDVAPGPFAVAFTPDGRTAVAPCGVGFLPDTIVAVLAPGAPPGDSVAIVDVIDGEVVAVVRTGDDSIPTGVAIHPDGHIAYVTNFGASTVSVIDLEARTRTANIDVPRQPEEIALRPDGKVLMVNSVSGSVSVIDTETLELLATVETGGDDPSGIAWADDGRTAYVANSFTNPDLGEDGTLTILDVSDPSAPRVLDTLTEAIGPTPYDVDVVPGGTALVATNLNVIFEPISIGPGSLALVDLGTSPPAVTTLPVGNAPIRAAVSGDGRVALVGNGLDQTVSVVDLHAASVVDTVKLAAEVGPADVAIQP